VKEALKKAGIEAEVKHGRGTAWGWLEINIGDPRLRNGLRQGPFGSQYTDEERVLHDKVLKIAKDITGRHGDYNSEILVLSQGWRTKSRPEVKRRIDVPVIPKIPEVFPEKKPEVKQIVESKPEVKRKRQKHSQPEIVMTEFGKTVIKKARGSTKAAGDAFMLTGLGVTGLKAVKQLMKTAKGKTTRRRRRRSYRRSLGDDELDGMDDIGIDVYCGHITSLHPS
jgi:hypothetical protein